MEAAANSEALAEQYKNEAFSGTPEGYAALVEQVGRIDIAKSTDYTLPNTKHGGLRLTKMVGNTVQNGTPTPSTPFPMLHTNDVVEMIQGWYNTSGEIANANDCIRGVGKIPCKVGDTIVLSNDFMKNYTVTFFNDNVYVNRLSAIVSGNSCVVPSGVNCFGFYLYKPEGITLDTVGKITLTINGKYVGCVKGHGKNFFKTNTVSGTTAIVVRQYIPSGTYTLSALVSSSDTDKTINRIIWHYIDGTSGYTNMARGTTRSKQKVNFTNDVIQIDFYASQNTDTSTDDTFTFADIQLEQGETMTDYEPYKETVAWYFTNEPTRIGDVQYKENGLHKVEHRTTEIVFDGSDDEGWNTWGTSYPNAFYHSLASIGLEKKSNVLCSHYSQITSAEINTVDYGITSQDYLAIKDIDCSTVDELKAKLASSPITVMTSLATPTIEVLDTESQINLNKLETFDTVTYIEVDSRVQPLGIEGEYGTSQVGAYTILALNENDIDKVERAEMKAQTETLRNMILSLGGNA